MLRRLHRALRPYDDDLGGMADPRDDVERLAGALRPADAEQADRVARLTGDLARIGPEVFATPLPTQALHGDVSIGNLLRTPNGWLWNDFEDAFRGPVHWDLASAVASLRLRGADESAVDEMLGAYGWRDRSTLAPFAAVQDIYDDIWQLYDRQRREAA